MLLSNEFLINFLAIQSLEVVSIDEERSLILVKGGVPGSIGGWVEITDAKILDYLELALQHPGSDGSELYYLIYLLKHISVEYNLKSITDVIVAQYPFLKDSLDGFDCDNARIGMENTQPALAFDRVPSAETLYTVRILHSMLRSSVPEVLLS